MPFVNNSTILDDLNKLSLEWIRIQRPILYFWVLDAILNMVIAIFMWRVLKKWKTYDGDLMFLIQYILGFEIITCLSFIVMAVCKLVYSYNGWPEAMSQEKCHALIGFQMYLLTVSAWLNFWISLDRFIALTKPLMYESR